MRKSSIATVSILAAATFAVTARADSPFLNGSDTLDEVTNDLIQSNCGAVANPPGTTTPDKFGPFSDVVAPATPPGYLQYAGGGSGTGQNQLVAGKQQVAPMSRALNGAACPSSTAQGLVVGLDGIALVGNDGSSAACGGRSGSTPSDLARSGDSISGSSYSYSDISGGSAGDAWKDVLRLLYAGIDHTGAKDCNSAARQALAASYVSLFHGGCTSSACTTIKHAYRRADPSGTTDTFLSLLGLPGNVTGAGGVVTQTAFCNGTDQQDNDPIRRPCTSDEQVCEFDGTLGLLLPVEVPTPAQIPPALLTAPYNETPQTVLYNASNSPRPNGDVDAFGSFLNAQGTRCVSAPPSQFPGFTPPAGFTGFPNTPRCDCRFPVPGDFVVAGVSATPNPAFTWNARIGNGCPAVTHPLASSDNPNSSDPKPVRWGGLNGDDGTGDNSPAAWGTTQVVSGKRRCCRLSGQFYTEDPRLMNLQLRNPYNQLVSGVWQGRLLGGEGVGALAESKFVTIAAFYRIHSDSRGQSSIPPRTSGFGTGLNYTTPSGWTPGTALCEKLDSTANIGCLVSAGVDKCSIGYAGREADQLSSAVGFSINGVTNTVANTENLVLGTGSVYPLARRLYINTLVGFAALSHTASDPVGPDAFGSPSTFNQAQYNLAKCFADTPHISASISAHGYIPIPAIPGVGNAAGEPVLCDNACSNPNCQTVTKIPASYFHWQ